MTVTPLCEPPLIGGFFRCSVKIFFSPDSVKCGSCEWIRFDDLQSTGDGVAPQSMRVCNDWTIAIELLADGWKRKEVGRGLQLRIHENEKKH
jgi:hypothetical protein